MSEQWNKGMAVHFEMVNEMADYRGNRQCHVYLVVNGLRVAATKGNMPSPRLIDLFNKEKERLEP